MDRLPIVQQAYDRLDAMHAEDIAHEDYSLLWDALNALEKGRDAWKRRAEAAEEDVPKKCLYCAKRHGWDTCKEAAFVSDGEECLNFKYGPRDEAKEESHNV